MKRELTERCRRVRELSENAMCRRYEACLAKNNPRASAADIAEAEAAERLAGGVCDREIQELVKCVEECMREDGIVTSDSYAPHRLAIFLAFAGIECCGDCGAAGSGAHN